METTFSNPDEPTEITMEFDGSTEFGRRVRKDLKRGKICDMAFDGLPKSYQGKVRVLDVRRVRGSETIRAKFVMI